MPVETLLSKKQYTADGVQTVFPFPYKFFKDTDVEVYVGSTRKTITADYTVAGIGSSFEDGGNFTFLVAPAAGSLITLARVLVIDQPTDYKDYGNFPNRQVNADFDRRAMIEQQLQEELARVVQAPITDPPGLTYLLPALELRILKALGFDAAGNLVAGNPANALINEAWQAALAQGQAPIVAGTFAKENYPLAAGYVPTVGDVVLMQPDETIVKAKRACKAALGSELYGARIKRIDNTHAVVIYSVALNLYAQVWLFDPVKMAAPSPVAAAQLVYTWAASHSEYDIAYIDATHVLVTYAAAVGASQGYVVALTCNTGTGVITVGTPVPTHATTQGPALAEIPGSSNIFMVWRTTTTQVAATVITGGSAPVYGTAYTAAVGGGTLGSPTSVKIDSTGTYALFAAQGSATAQGKAVIAGTVLTVSAATDSDFTDSWIEGPAGLWWSALGNNQNLQLSATPTFAPLTGGFLQVFESVTVNSCGSKIADFAGAVAFRVGKFTCGVTDHRLCLGFVAGGGHAGDFTRVRSGDRFMAAPGGTSEGPSGCDMLTADVGIAALATGSSAVADSQMAALRRRNKVIGVAVDALGGVQRTGICVLSGLTPGAVYYADDNGNLTTTPSEVKIGVARSATELLLDVRPGV